MSASIARLISFDVLLLQKDYTVTLGNGTNPYLSSQNLDIQPREDTIPTWAKPANILTASAAWLHMGDYNAPNMLAF